MIEFNTYQARALKTSKIKDRDQLTRILYYTLKLNGEAGEVAEKIAKWTIRDGSLPFSEEQRENLNKELGDVLWYIATLAYELDYSLEEIAKANIEKLTDRKERGVLQGSGDNR